MRTDQNRFIDVVHKLPKLDTHLIELLKGLSNEDWQKQTVAKLWKVKDVAAHLLDGNIRILSNLRDEHHGEKIETRSYKHLVDYLNQLNADWVKAMKRVSPQMLISLLAITGKAYYEYYASLDPYQKASYAVAWAGEQESKNWMHIAREYTEKFLHQQQIRDAIGSQKIMTTEYFFPFLDICMLALPHILRKIKASEGTTVCVTITSEAGGRWHTQMKEGSWQLVSNQEGQIISSEVILSPKDSWRLFSKSIRPDDIRDHIKISGDRQLGVHALNMVSFMA